MADLSDTLVTFARNSMEHSNIVFLISGSNSPGEGEIKCLDALLSARDTNESHALHSRDTDLVLMALACGRKNVHVFAFREDKGEDKGPEIFSTAIFHEALLPTLPTGADMLMHSYTHTLIHSYTHLFGLQVYVLDMKLFPSGQVYHENKKLVRKIQDKTYRPYVFHMCWTTNRDDKLIYFKDMGLWYLSETQPVCSSKGDSMLEFARIHGSRKTIRDKCCMRDRYWPDETVEPGDEV